MRRYSILIAGLLMVGAGAYLIFSNPQTLPLWFIWLAGPFLWYVGIAVSISGLAVTLFSPMTAHEEQASAKKRQQQIEVPVLHLRKFATGASPAGLVREIPAMGGFIL
jgi:hypothetical protein